MNSQLQSPSSHQRRMIAPDHGLRCHMMHSCFALSNFVIFKRKGMLHVGCSLGSPLQLSCFFLITSNTMQTYEYSANANIPCAQ